MIHFSELGGLADERAFNVYFVKEATQVWSRNEFCYIEAAAREHPEMNVCVVGGLQCRLEPFLDVIPDVNDVYIF